MVSKEADIIQKIVTDHNRDPERLMDMVRAVQAQAGFISDEAVETLARELKIHRIQVSDMASFYAFLKRSPAGKHTIRLSNDIVDRMAGLKEVTQAFEKELGISVGQTTKDGLFSLEYTACIGMSDQAPSALVDGMILTDIQPKDVAAIIKALRAEKRALTGLKVFPNAEVRTNLRLAGAVVCAAFENGSALRKALNMSPEGVIDEITKSKLRGRGGAGFPTGMKWSFCRKARGEHYILANGDEGEPGTFKDRLIFSDAADLLFEGMTIAGYALGAKEGILYLRAEYEYLWSHLEQVLARRRRLGLLGGNVCGREDFAFDIRIQMGAGAYICGEESALIESLEGKRGAPRDRPPYPVQKGFRNEPTSVNNPETLCCAARIIEKGADWFAQIGTRDSTGTKLLSVSGDCRYPGIYESEYGVSIDKLLNLVGGDDAQAVQVGGPSGQCLASRDFGRKISFEDIPTGGSVIVFGPRRDLLEVVHAFSEFFKEESCGWCVPCRVGTTLLLNKLEKVMEGKGTRSDLEELKSWGTTVKMMSRCGLGQTAANPILTTLQNFPELYRKRIREEEFLPAFDVARAFDGYAALSGRTFKDEESE